MEKNQEMESALKAIRTCAALDVKNRKIGSACVPYLVPEHVLKLCDKVLGAADEAT
jgi:hypothetical protein